MNWQKIKLGLSKTDSELLASKLNEKNLLEKERRYTFEPEKVHFCIIILLASRKTMVTSVMSKVNDSTAEVMEEQYQLKWDVNMMADYYWSIPRECLCRDLTLQKEF